MTLKLTESQRQAVERDDTPLAVVAGAGSGKTAVLVQRYLRLVLKEEIPPQKILAATFTDKAAAQMKEKVANEFNRAGREECIAELNAAPICTLHSYCSRLISPMALDLGLDPGYRIIDSFEADLLQEECLKQVLARWHDEHPDDITLIVRKLYWSGDYGLRPGRAASSRGFSRQLLELVNAARCAGQGKDAPFKPLNVNGGDHGDSVDLILKQIDDFFKSATPGKAEKSQDKIRRVRDLLLRYSHLTDQYSEEIPKILDELSGIKPQGSALAREIIKNVRDTLVPHLFDRYFSPTYESVRKILNRLYEEFLNAYWLKKKEIGALDFLDLEEIALDLLRSGTIQTPVDRILIDEAQDLNPVQWEIINKLREGAPVFAVGDAQQSIYGFRHADVSLFSNFAAGAKKAGGDKIPLPENFRSRETILGVVNHIFKGILKESQDAPFLELKGSYPYPPAEADNVELLVSFASNRQDARQAEARHLARRILELVKGKTFKIHREMGKREDGTPILEAVVPQWRDVLVLFRSGSSLYSLEKAFREFDIPFIIQSGRGFWDSMEVSDFMALLRSLEDPGDDFNLACLLRSPGAGFSDDDLVELRVEAIEDSPPDVNWKWRTRSLYEGLQQFAGNGDGGGDLGRRCKRFLSIFHWLYQRKDRLPTRTLLEYWMEETNLEAFWSGLPEGHLIHSNVRKLLRLCDKHAGKPATEIRAAFDEVRVRELREGGAPVPLAGEGAVSMMTVHGAKGLEAPIVALFDMNYRPKSSQGSSFAYARNHGAAFCLNRDALEQSQHKPVIFKEIKAENDERAKAEGQRILYVAMTRAREKLLLSGSCATDEKGVKQTTGWFRLLIDELNVDIESVYDTAAEPFVPVPLLNKYGETTGIELRRAFGLEISKPESPPAVMPAGGGRESAPADFSAPEPGTEPISVVEWLRNIAGRSETSSGDDELELSSDEPEELFGVGVGRWAHRLLQVLHPDDSEEKQQEAARGAAFQLFSSVPDEKDINRVLHLVGNYFQSELAREVEKAKRVVREFPVLFELEKVKLKGTVDLAFEDDEGWTLVDYKSYHPDPSDLKGDGDRYRKQLLLYALGWQKLTGQLPVRALLFYLQDGVTEPISLHQESLDGILSTLRTFKEHSNT